MTSRPGRALDPAVREDFGRRYGHDFAHVRVHDDSTAAASAAELGAAAYTAGRAIVFGAGRYEPGTGRGRRLVGHELAHVAQQGTSSVPRGPFHVDPSPAAETRATRVAAGGVTTVRRAGLPQGLVVQRQTPEEEAKAPPASSSSAPARTAPAPTTPAPAPSAAPARTAPVAPAPSPPTTGLAPPTLTPPPGVLPPLQLRVPPLFPRRPMTPMTPQLHLGPSTPSPGYDPKQPLLAPWMLPPRVLQPDPVGPRQPQSDNRWLTPIPRDRSNWVDTTPLLNDGPHFLRWGQDKLKDKLKDWQKGPQDKPEWRPDDPKDFDSLPGEHKLGTPSIPIPGS